MALQNLPKFGIYGLKKYHLATLEWIRSSFGREKEISSKWPQQLL
jgi:hypothetical protein